MTLNELAKQIAAATSLWPLNEPYKSAYIARIEDAILAGKFPIPIQEGVQQ